jgi:hypothetical protein
MCSRQYLASSASTGERLTRMAESGRHISQEPLFAKGVGKLSARVADHIPIDHSNENRRAAFRLPIETGCTPWQRRAVVRSSSPPCLFVFPTPRDRHGCEVSSSEL